MDLAANELSIYDKLSETVDLVRQTGHQCGMSEKAIEKFIRQLLEKNEPQRGPPQYPLLIAIYKVKMCSDVEIPYRAQTLQLSLPKLLLAIPPLNLHCSGNK